MAGRTQTPDFDGAKLKALMREQGETPMNVAFALGVTETTVRRWREGRVEPKTDYVKRLANLLGVEVKDLYSE